MKRSVEEILKRINGHEANGTDFFGWARELLIGFLPFNLAKPFLIEGATEADWERREDPRADCIGYLPFAWEKCRGERGISANRSVDKIREWIWLMGDEDLLRDFEAAPYPMYGRPKLEVVTIALAPELLDE